jgi:uncharacterized membrane protein YraQ (UPF0718 family)
MAFPHPSKHTPDGPPGKPAATPVSAPSGADSIRAQQPEEERKAATMPDALVFLTILFALLSMLCLTIAYQQRNGTLTAGLHSTWTLFRQVLPLGVLALIFAGYVRVLVPSAPQAAAPEPAPSMKVTVFVSTMIFLILLGAAMLHAYLRHDGTFSKGLRETWQMFAGTWLLLVAAWIFSGYITALLPKEFILEWLGRESGVRGILIACVAGAVTPGGPFISLPIIGALYKAGAGEGVVVAYLSSWSLYAFGRMPFEFYFLGERLAVVRLASSLVFPPLAGLVAKLFFEAGPR